MCFYFFTQQLTFSMQIKKTKSVCVFCISGQRIVHQNIKFIGHQILL